MKSDVEIFVPVSNEFQWELGPFFHFFDKHWDAEQPVTVLTADDPGIARANYVPVKAGMRDGDWHYGRFSDGLKEFMKNDCGKPLVAFLQADYWLSKPVKKDIFWTLVDYMLEHPRVTRMAISVNGKTFSDAIPHEKWRGVTVMKCPKDKRACFFPMSLLPAIWNREHWQGVLENRWNPWETETRGYDAYMANENLVSLTMNEPPLEYHHAARTRSKTVCSKGIPEEDWQVVKSMVPGGFQIA